MFYNILFQANVKDLIPYDSMCCVIRSCYCNFPLCLGCQGDYTCLCIEQSYKSCKPVANDEDILCSFCEGGCYIVPISTCCKSVDQCFCLDSRCAFPCDDDVPCICGSCFITCCYKFQCKCACCQSIGQIDPEIQNQATIVQHIYIQQAPTQTATPVVVAEAVSNPVHV